MSKIYNMYEMESGKAQLPTELNYFIFAANTDLRSYNSLSILKNNKCKIENTILFDYKKLKPTSANSTGEKLPDSEYKKLNENYHKYERFNPLICCCNEHGDDTDRIKEMEITENTRVGIDITGFTIPDVFRIIYVLKEIKKIRNLYVYYTEPQYYIFKEDIFDTYEHLSGERTYGAIQEYYSSENKLGKTLLVLFFGFDLSVSDYIYEKAYPAEAVVINGFPSYFPKLKDISLLNNYSLLSSCIDDNHKFYVRANNPFSTYNALCDIREQYLDYLMNICVLGTKPMALGACLFSLKNNKNLKVTYPHPQQYLLNTTETYTKAWYYIIDFT